MPMVMFGTKWPSITSTWSWSAPPASTRAMASPSAARAHQPRRLVQDRTLCRRQPGKVRQLAPPLPVGIPAKDAEIRARGVDEHAVAHGTDVPGQGRGAARPGLDDRGAEPAARLLE